MSCKHSNKSARAAAQGFWGLVAAGEPFRLLFPLGTVIGLFGVLMWPLYIWNVTEIYPGQAHARIMIQGFLTCFVIGFLGTALPRLLDVPRITLAEALAFAGGLTVVVMLQNAGFTFWGDLLFLLVFAGFLVALGTRVPHRRDTPPPGFVLVGLGLLCALLGTMLQMIASASPGLLPVWTASLGRLLLYQGFLLLPIMGIGAFLLPRFFGLPNRQSFPESLALPPGWKERAVFALGCGAVVLASFVLEARGNLSWGYGLRALAVLAWFFREVPVHQAGFGGGSLAFGLRLALFSIPLGYALMAFMPQHAYALLHVVLVSGFSLLTFIVASRVILGHSGQAEKFRARLWPVAVMTWLVILAMITRVSADWMPHIRLSHYGYAGGAWVLAVVIWAIWILPSVRRADAAG